MINKRILENMEPFDGASDLAVNVAIGSSAQSKSWETIQIPWPKLVKAFSKTKRTNESFSDYKLLNKASRSRIKDVGGFMGGSLSGPRRLNEAVTKRSLITLDFDGPDGSGMRMSLDDLINKYTQKFNNEAAFYTTHTHEGEAPRVRLIIPMAMELDPCQYDAISRGIAAELGADEVDAASYVLSQFMFWPSTAADGDFQFHHVAGELLKPDEIISRQEPEGVTKAKDEPDLFDLVDLTELEPLTDEQIIQKASAAANGQKFTDLFRNGPGPDHSKSDLALCNTLAFYTRKDQGQMDRIFRQSALYRSKWDEIHDPEHGRTYGQMTIDKAIAGTVEVYCRKPRESEAAGEDIPYFEFKNMYWKKVKKNNGEETAVPISNFILKPIREVEIIESDQVVTECQAVNSYGEVKKVQILPSDFNTNIKFNDAVDSKNMRFNGSLTDLQFVKTLVANHVVQKVVGTETNGFHTIEGKRVYIDSAGIVGGDEDSLVSMAVSPFESSITAEDPITLHEFYEILPMLFNFNTMANTTSIIGWSCATYLKDLFKENKIKFPHLFISGTAGSGKSETLSHVLSPILGINNSPVNANDNTKYALGLMSNSSNHIPILIEEYKPRKMDRWKVQGISDIMRNTYDSHISVRGMPSKRGKTEVLALQAPLVVCGEEMTEEKANLERTIFCTFGREDSQKYTNYFQGLKQRSHLLRKLGRSLLDQSLKMTSDELMTYYKEADSLKEMDNLKSSRTRSNVAVTICGLYLLNDVIKSLGIERFNISDDGLHIIENATKEENENGGTLNDVDETLNTMSHICGLQPENVNRAMCDPVHINENGDLLYLRVKEVYAASSKYLKDNGLENNLMSLTQFEKLIQKESIFDSNRKLINTPHKDGYKSQKALSLKILEMEGRKIDLSGFVMADQYYKAYLIDEPPHRGYTF